MDALAMFERHDARQEAALLRRPICCECGQHIQEEKFFRFDLKNYCVDCMESHMEYTEDFEN